MKFNINEKVKVKLTPKGNGILRDKGENPNDLMKDENGFVEFQLWELMNLFGQQMYNGCTNIPFETTIIIPDKKAPPK
jgi:hypothetical protein